MIGGMVMDVMNLKHSGGIVIIMTVTMLLFAGCSRTQDKDFLGSAVVDVRTYQASATVQGQLISVLKNEGDDARKGDLLALIDTVPSVLKLREIEARRRQLKLEIASRSADITAVKSEVSGLKRELDRISDLAKKGSVPMQQKDKLETQYATAQAKLESAQRALSAASAKLEVLQTKKEQVEDQLRRCTVLSPVEGTILIRFKNQGEIAAPGLPLYEIAAYDTAQVDFFVPQPVLSQISVGRTVRIRIDRPENQDAFFVPARITWIADEAEFSPKNIQTRQARNELVFQVRAQAANTDRVLKRGLPVEVWRGEME
ncbi:MAG: HlyD family efflux transporter periplasmic adaptor subunit [Chitinivibrionales bacterium]|nr:HlyD family efflux transporter periplasmic adaptor subunit [Chitinivibrionales bacterium]